MLGRPSRATCTLRPAGSRWERLIVGEGRGARPVRTANLADDGRAAAPSGCCKDGSGPLIRADIGRYYVGDEAESHVCELARIGDGDLPAIRVEWARA